MEAVAGKLGPQFFGLRDEGGLPGGSHVPALRHRIFAARNIRASRRKPSAEDDRMPQIIFWSSSGSNGSIDGGGTFGGFRFSVGSSAIHLKRTAKRKNDFSRSRYFTMFSGPTSS